MDATPSSTAGSLGASLADAAQPWDSKPSLPSVGRGQSLDWAKSWVELSRGMNTIGMSPYPPIQSREFQQGSALDSAYAVADRLEEMTRVSAATSVTAVRFTLMSGVVTGASSAVHKLLSQQ